MPTPHTGSCLCGAIRFQVDGDFNRFFLCHCSRCRKGTGSAHGANLFATQGTLTWLAGEEQVRVFNLPGARHGKAFCATCGSALPRGTQPGGLVVVPAGSLDSPVEIRPYGHIFMGSRADWDHDLDAVPQADTYLR